ncbi:hypothetical protein OAN59_10800 [Alphaproteobacteria bacterium]|nr:hypothetical protein [Alphaproteobacteria bacterium]
MSENTDGKTAASLPPEDSERVNRIAKEIMEPALQNALRSAEGKAPPVELMSALANTYASLLVDLLGHSAAASFMRGHADHIASLEPSSVSE